MRNWLAGWAANIAALGIVVAGYWQLGRPLKGFNPTTTQGIWADSFVALLMAVVALALANSIVRPVILFFAWPVNCMTFGLFAFVLNILLFWVVGNVVPGFHVNGPIAPIVGSIAMGLLTGMITPFLEKNEKKKKD